MLPIAINTSSTKVSLFRINKQATNEAKISIEPLLIGLPVSIQHIIFMKRMNNKKKANKVNKMDVNHIRTLNTDFNLLICVCLYHPAGVRFGCLV